MFPFPFSRAHSLPFNSSSIRFNISVQCSANTHNMWVCVKPTSKQNNKYDALCCTLQDVRVIINNNEKEERKQPNLIWIKCRRVPYVDMHNRHSTHTHPILQQFPICAHRQLFTTHSLLPVPPIFASSFSIWYFNINFKVYFSAAFGAYIHLKRLVRINWKKSNRIAYIYKHFVE